VGLRSVVFAYEFFLLLLASFKGAVFCSGLRGSFLHNAIIRDFVLSCISSFVKTSLRAFAPAALSVGQGRSPEEFKELSADH
jgi:hypothetical protein